MSATLCDRISNNLLRSISYFGVKLLQAQFDFVAKPDDTILDRLSQHLKERVSVS